MAGTLFLVATPIGNLSDISRRAIDTLGSVGIIACEDTRHTGKLLKESGIRARLISHHDHNEKESADVIANALSEGVDVALVTDAGSPGISDPGFRAVIKALEVGAEVRAVPGPSAVIAALGISGIPTDAFYFGGFLPARKGERISKLKEASLIPSTLVFYEAPHRIEKCLADCISTMGDRQACLSREITKLHEETIRGKLSEILKEVSSQPRKGEMVLVIDRVTPEDSMKQGPEPVLERYRELVGLGTEPKKALKTVAKEFGITRSEAYRMTQIAE